MKAVYSFVFLIGYIALISNQLIAQEYYQTDVRAKSLAGITVCTSSGWSAFGNQAGLTAVDCPEIGISYSNYFLLSELALKSAYAVAPFDKNFFAISFYRFGTEAYNENKLGFGFSKQITPGFSAGFQFNYFFIHLPENDKTPGDLSFEGGIQYRLSKKLLFGAHCFNPFQSGIRTDIIKYKIPCQFKFGAAYRISDCLSLYCEFEKDLRYEIISKFGLEYLILENVRISGGFAGKDNLMAMGIGYLKKRIITNISWQYNHRLGSTPAVAISYMFK